MKLHLPVFLRKSVLASMTLFLSCTLGTGASALASSLVLGDEDSLCIDYAAADSIPDLAGGTLQLEGDTLLQLLNCGLGDGKTYTLATGISSLLDAEGNLITLDSTYNAASLYFDATQSGTGFWADGELQLVNGVLQLVLHTETVKDAQTITSRKKGRVDYQWYAGVRFENIVHDAGSSAANGGAIDGGSSSTITLSNNGSVVFEGNSASGSNYVSGGAISGGNYSTIELSNNGSVVFEGNTASSTGYSAYGGAIYGGLTAR